MSTISYHPDFQRYQALVKHRLATESLTDQLPTDFPQQLRSNLVWDSFTAKNEPSHRPWLLILTATQLEEVEAALLSFKTLGVPLGQISPSVFPLPTLSSALRSISRDLHINRGFATIRGIDPRKYSRQDVITIYAGVSSHIGLIRGRQDTSFDGKPADVVLSHIMDLNRGGEKQDYKLAACTNDKVVFHTDTAEIVALFALSVAGTGGESLIASSWKVYNELAKTRPDLIETLSQDWTMNSHGSKQTPSSSRPLLFHQPAQQDQEEKTILQFSRRTFTGYGNSQGDSEPPKLTNAQAEALDAIHFTAEKHQIVLPLQPGDMQYINNLSILHGRNAYMDDESVEGRHLLRLWLRDPEYSWETPEKLKPRWNKVYQGLTEESQVFPLEPYARSIATGGK